MSKKIQRESSEISKEKLDEVVRCYQSSFPKSIFTILGHNFVYVYLNWFLKSENRVLITCFDDRKCLGFCAAYYRHYPGEGPVVESFKNLFRYKPWLVLLNICVILRHLVKQSLFGSVKSIIRSYFKNHFLISKRIKYDPNSYSDEVISGSRSFGLVAIGVAPFAEGLKIGTNLLKAYETEATRLNCNFCRLTVKRNNVRAIAFYKKNGWERQSISNEASKNTTTLNLTKRINKSR